MALANSPLLAQAEAKVEQARGQVIAGGPLSESALRRRQPASVRRLAKLVQHRHHAAGGNRRQDSAGRGDRPAGAEQAQYRLAQRQFELLTDVRRQFFALLAAQERLETRQAAANQQRAIAEYQPATVRRRARAPETDVLLLRVQLSRIEVNVANMATSSKPTAGLWPRRSACPICRSPGPAAIWRLPLPNFEQQRGPRAASDRELGAAGRPDRRRPQPVSAAAAEVAWIPDVECQGGYQYTVMPTRNQVVIGTYFDVPLWNRNQGNILATSADVRGSRGPKHGRGQRPVAATFGRRPGSHYAAARRWWQPSKRRFCPTPADRSAWCWAAISRANSNWSGCSTPSARSSKRPRLHFRPARPTGQRRRRRRPAATRTISLRRFPSPGPIPAIFHNTFRVENSCRRPHSA